MNNTKDMASSIVALRHAAVALNNIADFLEFMNAKDSAPATENQFHGTESAPSTDAVAPAANAEPENPKLSFEDVHGILADIARKCNYMMPIIQFIFEQNLNSMFLMFQR